MHKRIFFDKQDVNSYESCFNYFNEIIMAIVGPLDYTTCVTAKESTNNFSVNDTVYDWELVSSGFDPSNPNYKGHWILRSEVTDSPGLYKYVCAYMDSTSRVRVSFGNAPDESRHTNNYDIYYKYTATKHDKTTSARTSSYATKQTVPHYVDINVSKAHIFISAMAPEAYALIISEHVRTGPHNLPGDPSLPLVGTTYLNSSTWYGHSYKHILLGTTHNVNDAKLYIGYRDFANSQDSFRTAYLQNGVYKTFLYRPTFGYYETTLGPLHPLCPFYAIGKANPSGDPANNLPSNLPGAEVVISGRRFIVIDSDGYSSTTTYPYYLEVI